MSGCALGVIHPGLPDAATRALARPAGLHCHLDLHDLHLRNAAGKRSRIVFRKFNDCAPDPRPGCRRPDAALGVIHAGLHRHFDLHAGFEAVDVAVGESGPGENAAGKRLRIVFRKFNECVPDPRQPTRRPAGLHRHLGLHAGFEAVDVAVLDWIDANWFARPPPSSASRGSSACARSASCRHRDRGH